MISSWGASSDTVLPSDATRSTLGRVSSSFSFGLCLWPLFSGSRISGGPPNEILCRFPAVSPLPEGRWSLLGSPPGPPSGLVLSLFLSRGGGHSFQTSAWADTGNGGGFGFACAPFPHNPNRGHSWCHTPLVLTGPLDLIFPGLGTLAWPFPGLGTLAWPFPGLGTFAWPF